MKIIIETTTNIVKYAFENEVSISIENDKIIAPNFIIGDLNSSSATLIENIENIPSDYIGDKYTYLNGTWTIREAWVEAEEPEE
jgi:hypothetical protein